MTKRGRATPSDKIQFISLSKFPSQKANAIQTMRVCEGFVQAGYHVRLWAPRPTPDAESDLAFLQAFYGVESLPDISWIPRWAKKAQLAAAYASVRASFGGNRGIVYCRSASIAVVARTLGLPTILEVHALSNLSDRWWNLIQRWPWRRRVMVIAISEALAAEARRRGPGTQARVGVQPDAAQVSSVRRTEPPTGAGERPRAIYAGTIAPGRGVELILDIARLSPWCDFVLAGSGPADYVQEFQLELGEHENVEYVGSVDPSGVRMFLATADYLLAPYQHDLSSPDMEDTTRWMSPLKVFEYLSAGRPILVSDLPVLREVLDERCALLLPPDEPAAWSAQMQLLAGNPRLREQLGAEAFERVASWTWKHRAVRIMDSIAW